MPCARAVTPNAPRSLAQPEWDKSLPAEIRSMVGSEQSWAAVASFTREVMAAKREALRERERANKTR
ncbi:hypothetical protein RR46_01780 [Papilio xuthus]|uniref:Uncharacterized protein n=1 Tax=Papilio xuthus TaxID=66420 RepID=A0A194QH55_PAPXU|nr:hypothetical protein RR46_01780 [Papilio xuthus]